jgi:hypothetical protein
MKRVMFFAAVCVSTVIWVNIQAGIPKLINYQGMLTDVGGTPLDGAYNLTFRIYDDTTGAGTLQWTETQNGVEVDHGLFNVALGKSTALNLAFDKSYWLEVQVGAEVMPRIRFTSVGYAYRSRVADTASVAVAAPTAGGWTDEGSVVRLTTNTDKVGIGTSTPGAELEVFSSDEVDLWLNRAGTGWAAVLSFRRGGGLDWSIFTPSGDTSLLISNRNYQTVQSFLQNGNVGIGTASPTSKLDVSGDINTSSSYGILGNTVLSTPNWNVFVGGAAGYSNTTGSFNTMVGTNAGDNNTTGSYNIFLGDYAGRFNTRGSYNIVIGDAASYWDSSGSYNTILGAQAGHNNDTGSYNVFVGNQAGYHESGSNKLYIANSDADPPLIYGDFSKGYIGLGTTDPQRKLHIVGDNPRILIEATSISPEVNFKNSGDPLSTVWALYKDGGTDDFKFYQNGDKVTIRNASGNVGIGTTDPTEKLDVDGTARLRGILAGSYAPVHVDTDGKLWKESSSRRYKQSIRRLEVNSEKVLELSPVRFQWKTTHGEDVGLIAEDVEQVLPELVVLDAEGRPDAVKYDKVALYLLELVKVQQQRISALEREVAELRR